MLRIDGSQGEGGGQIVRTAVSLSCITGRPIHIDKVRARRAKPGLARQHLTSIRAAQEITAATVIGDAVGSCEFSFQPGPVRPGDYTFEIGTAGSTALVLQTVALPLALAASNSSVAIVGGTHNPMAPCYEYLESVWAPLLALAGVHIYLQIKRAGFYPAGGGRIEAKIVGMGPPDASDGLRAVSILERGEIYSIDGFSAVARLPGSIAERQAKQAELRLAAAGLTHFPIHCQSIDAASPGTVLFLNCRCRGAPAAFFGLGARGKRAEQVADEAADQVIEHLGRPGALDPHAADQLVLPLALAPGPSAFTTTRVTSHLTTHVHLLRMFLERRIEISGREDEPGSVEIK